VHRLPRQIVLPLVLAAMFAAVVPAANDALAASEDVLTVASISNRADLVSGDNVLLEITPSSGLDPSLVSVDVDGRDVTDAFAVRADGRFLGLVDGLALGDNTVTASQPNGNGATLTVTNYPIGGPIFSGPQIGPWYCLPDALDDQCNRPTVIAYQYKSSITGQFSVYDPDAPALDVATTTTDQNVTVPYIVRVETGNMDRSQYRIALLVDPAESWDRWSGPSGWNHKVYMTHGAGCGMGHSEGAAPDVMVDDALGRGFAVMSTALEHNTENCNNVVQAESVMMAKEHLIEQYGDVRYLFGNGGSGGAIAQLHQANAFPGLYDGLTVAATYPDIPTMDLLDCPALLRYWDDPTRWAPGVVWNEVQSAAAAGLASTSPCRSWGPTFSVMFDPTTGVSCDIPEQEPETVYHPQTNKTGVRCSYQDYLVNILGTRAPEDWEAAEQEIGAGFAKRPYDNVGLMYGLRAVMAGEISPAQFADLNVKVGAVDIDYGTQATRVKADPAVLAATYRSGVLNQGNELDKVAIIDMPISGDRYEFHDNYKSWGLRARLVTSNGHADNHVIWYGPENNLPGSFDVMDEWLAGVEADVRNVPVDQKVVANKPAGAVDRCETPERSSCDFVFGSAGNIRWAAGAPTLANDVIKCQLKPLQRNSFAPVLFTDADWVALQGAFPNGVCDWTKPGVEQQGSVAWQDYSDGPGGIAMDPVPTSVAFSPGASVLSQDATRSGRVGLPATGGGLAVMALMLTGAGAMLSWRRRRAA
jgi:hypothetical protein